ncbi:MAG: flagellar hook-basal body complex protein [Gemmobacter sp.]|nr:flagellar hook-basal body complex protein [Gemmobacter sp.]
MTISSALNAGVAGLNANASRLATISDNIANSGTYGYKRVTTDFEALVMTGQQNASSYSAGGVRSSSSRLIAERGALVSTSSALDLAVSGRGMLPVAPQADADAISAESLQLTTTASFSPDRDGYLKTDSGLVLMGWPAAADGTVSATSRDTVSGLQPVVIRTNDLAGDPTTAVKLGVNLPATGTEAEATGEALPLTVEYYGNLGTTESLQFTFTPTVPADGSSNSWRMVVTDSASDGAVVGEYDLVFDATRDGGGALASVTVVAGGAYDAATGAITLDLGGGPLVMEIGTPGGESLLTQIGDSFSPTAVGKDGSPVGTLTGVEVNEAGLVVATYDTGFTRTLFQVPLVDVPNPDGLTPLDNQAYGVSPDSGAFFLWDAGEGPTGNIAGYAREGSTTDVAAELTSLIQTQRAYSSNAKVIQTVDEMLQETTNIKR